MVSLPARVRHAFASSVANTTDNNKVGSAKWNADLEIFLGTVCEALSTLNLSGDTMAYFTGGSSAQLTALSAFGRLVIAANDKAEVRSLLSAVSLAGDTMSGNLNFAGIAKVTGLAAPTDATDAATKAYVDALATVVSGALVFKGAWDASAGTFPGASVAQTGWFYKVSVAGTVDGKTFSVGDDLFAIVNNASTSTYAANWLKIEGSITLAEVEAAIGFTFGSLAALSSITTAYISDMSANGKSLVTAANYAAMRTLLMVDVSGPSSSTDNAAARFDAATGKIIKNSALIIADTTGSLSRAGNGGIPLQGTNTNDNAGVGDVGEYVSSTVPIASAVALSSGAPANVTSILLSAGDWEVGGNVAFVSNPATTTSILIASINTVSNTLPTLPAGGGRSQVAGTFPGGIIECLQSGEARISLNTPTTIYLVAQANFAVDIMTAFGFIRGRRVR
ncbi:MAG: hypothetical protein WC670_09665 [Pseudolabrys sp.]|jgi:hypothetical protein